MRKYAIVAPQIWIGNTGRKLRGHLEAQIVAFYLISNPHANMLGLYYLPVTFISHETGLPFEGALKGLRRASEALFCDYDEATEMVWVFEMARFQIDEALKATDNRCKAVQEAYDSLPQNRFLSDFFDRYASVFHLENRRENGSPSEAPSKPLRSQEQEQEQEQDVPPNPPKGGRRKRGQVVGGYSDQVREVVNTLFGEWPKSQPKDGSPIRKDLAATAARVGEILRDYREVTPELLILAAKGYLEEEGRTLFKAPQFFFGPGQGKETPVWLERVNLLLHLQRQGVPA